MVWRKGVGRKENAVPQSKNQEYWAENKKEAS
jgi:hypothetical protein